MNARLATRNSMKRILAIDQGTTSCRAIVFEETGAPIASAQREFQQHFPQPGWVEHDAEEIWAVQSDVILEALERARLGPGDLAAIGVTNQRETTVLWDRRSGRPLAPAIVWQDRRTAADCDRLQSEGLAPKIQEKTGLVPDAYFSATKLRWLLDNVPGARARAESGELAFGTVDSWLVSCLSRGRLHITDATNASRTMLFNLKTGAWDDELLQIFGIPRSLLPEIRNSSEVYGSAEAVVPGVPISGIAGDQHAALFGQACIHPGMMKCTFGTGCFMLMYTGAKPMFSRHKLLTTVAWRIGGKDEFALEGSVFIAGAVVQYLRDGLRLIRSSGEIEALAASVPDNAGVYFVPAFAGLGAPHWDQRARGAILGLTRGAGAGHLARAALEAIAFQVADVAEAMTADTGIPLGELRVDGGASVNNLLMQMQADLLGCPVLRPRNVETTAQGVAFLAGLGAGIYRDRDEIAALWAEDRRFVSECEPVDRERRRAGWRKAVRRASDWEGE